MSDPVTYTATFVLAKTNEDHFGTLLGLAEHAQDIRVLSADKALDFDIRSGDIDTFKHNAQALIGESNLLVDWCLQPTEGRKKTLLICDMDSTLIGQECIDELADFADVKDRVSTITERAMRGEIDFEGALKERVNLLKNLPLSTLQTCFDERITLNDGARTLAQTMKANGAKTVIVSGGFTFFSARIAKLAGFDIHQANVLLETGDTLSGEVALPILGREAKQAALEAHSADMGGPSNALAIGDGANDLAMITAAGLGIAYYAKPAVAAAAHCAINHTDLTTALYFQGYNESEFTS